MRKNRISGVVNWEKYFSVDNVVFNEYLASYGDDFLKATIENIKQAVNDNKPYLILIEFINTNIVCIVKKSEYVSVLHKMLELCEHLEKYELCSEIIAAINVTAECENESDGNFQTKEVKKASVN